MISDIEFENQVYYTDKDLEYLIIRILVFIKKYFGFLHESN